MHPLNKKLQATWRKALQIFQESDGRRHGDIFTPTQLRIVDTIVKRRYPRTQLILPTQYGKSMAVGDGVLMRAANYPEKWAIVAPTEDKARIIMDYIIEHIFDDKLFYERLDYYESKEQLKKERSKTRITFRDAGEIRVYTGSAGNTKAVKKALMGFGAPNIILDEAALIPDDLYATVKRMLGGTADNFLLEIGNPSFRNHFHRTWYGDRYKKVFMNAEMALAEGRYTRDFLDEMKDEIGYDWMYDCIFPDANEILPNGYRRLVSDVTLEKTFIDSQPEIVKDDRPVLGVDVAAGGKNKTKFVVRYPKSGFAMLAGTSESDDLEEIADKVQTIAKQHNIGDYRVFPDAGGVGHGLAAILRARGMLVKPVLFGESAGDKAFSNMRAYMYWQARKWLMVEGGKLMRNDGFLELKLINYRQNSSLKLQIEPKEEMMKRLSDEGIKVESPDTADAFVLTFVDTSSIVEEEDIYIEGDDDSDDDGDIYEM
jgi:hypothetical protein